MRFPADTVSETSFWPLVQDMTSSKAAEKMKKAFFIKRVSFGVIAIGGDPTGKVLKKVHNCNRFTDLPFENGCLNLFCWVSKGTCKSLRMVSANSSGKIPGILDILCKCQACFQSNNPKM